MFTLCWLLVSSATLLPQPARSGKTNLAWEYCSQESAKHGPESQAIITGLFPVRRALEQSANDDHYEPQLCGPLSVEGVQTVEATKWALSNLNRDYGSVFGEKVGASFVPGVQIGKLNREFLCSSRFLLFFLVFERSTVVKSPDKEFSFT